MVTGMKGIVEFDNNQNETETILSKETTGTVEIAEDGTLVWVENGDGENVSRFIRN